ncbi:acyltransferase domain-containing protein [Nonomuraea sp. CA-143628]|uniref:acyltransferase domain-containing protein n=1 Tax=Nonomuraea sp. CA-143628 TaxID=3239997 RepID=UPI003D922258
MTGDGRTRTRLLAWSGADEHDWRQTGAALERWLTTDGPPEFQEAVDQWRPPTPAGPVRGAVLAATHAEALAGVRASAPRQGRRRPVALLFPGQGAQHARMGAGLYQRDPEFTARMDEVFGLFGPHGRAIRDDWRSPRPALDLDDLRRAQPLLFAVDWALGRLVLSWGVRPAALLGHSVGEVAAAALAGVFTMADAVTVMRDRIDRLTGLPPGGMLAVAAGPDELRPFLADLDGAVVVGAVNAARQVMLAGLDGPLRQVERGLRAAGYGCRRARATTAFHSPAIAAALAGSREVMAGLALRPPAIPLYSGYTGGLMSPGTATDVDFWADQPAEPVLFGPALDRLLAEGDYLLVEAGPSESLTALARRHPKVRSGAGDVAALLPAGPGEGERDRRAVLAAAAKLWLEGHDLDLERF